MFQNRVSHPALDRKERREGWGGLEFEFTMLGAFSSSQHVTAGLFLKTQVESELEYWIEILTLASQVGHAASDVERFSKAVKGCFVMI